jgi:hypothetical protein
VPRHHLSLVEAPPETDLEATDPTPRHPIPFSIRLTIDQVLDLADDADLRAQILQWAAQEMPQGSDVGHRVLSLRQVAIELRKVAAHLDDCWAEVGESS